MTAPVAALAPAHEVSAPVRTNLTLAREIAGAIRKAARELDALAGLSDMQSAVEADLELFSFRGLHVPHWVRANLAGC